MGWSWPRLLARRIGGHPILLSRGLYHGGAVGSVDLIDCPEVRLLDFAVVATALPHGQTAIRSHPTERHVLKVKGIV